MNNAAELLPDVNLEVKQVYGDWHITANGAALPFLVFSNEKVAVIACDAIRALTRAPSAEYRRGVLDVIAQIQQTDSPEYDYEIQETGWDDAKVHFTELAHALIPVSTADLDARHADRMRRSSWLLPHEAVDCNGECVIHAASPAPVSTAPESKFKAELIGHGLMKVERPASPATVLHCSCGAAVTKEEYQQHRAAGHDASPATVPAGKCMKCGCTGGTDENGWCMTGRPYISNQPDSNQRSICACKCEFPTAPGDTVPAEDK